jgi:glycosyltransferase involved in cell wall biosynthesis
VDCSVVITTYNRARLLADTLRSLSAQQTPRTLRWEVIIVDNNSRDETKEVVQRFRETASLTIRYEFEPRQGQSFARNRGIEVAEGAVILFTDDDILPNPDWVSTMLRTIVIDHLDGAGGRVLPLWEAPVPRWLSSRGDLLPWLAVLEDDKACMLEYPVALHGRVVGASMAFRREVFEEFGRFLTNLGHRGSRLYGGEEVEFINRLLLKGRPIRYDPSIVVRHRIGANRLRKSFFLRRHFDHACGQAQFLPGESGGKILGVGRWRYRLLMKSVWTTVMHTALRRPDAFSLQLALALDAGWIWGSLRWPFDRYLNAGG